MPRTARVDGLGAVHHVMMRGIARQRIFLRDADLTDWVNRMGRVAPAHQMRCFAWALMPNHVHLVVRSGRGGLSQVMARINTGYARGFNLRHDRNGYLFENRFKSRLVHDDADLLNLIRYVHMNPVKAQLVSSLDSLARHPWCGHGALMGTRSPFPFENVDFVLRFFASSRSGARRRLDRWMAEDFDHVGAPGDVKGNLLPDTEDPMDQGDGTLDEVIERVCSHFGLSTEDIASSRRRGALSEARAAIAFLGVTRLGLSGSRVAEQIGLSRSGVSRAIDRGAEICSNEHLV